MPSPGVGTDFSSELPEMEMELLVQHIGLVPSEDEAEPMDIDPPVMNGVLAPTRVEP